MTGTADVCRDYLRHAAPPIFAFQRRQRVGSLSALHGRLRCRRQQYTHSRAAHPLRVADVQMAASAAIFVPGLGWSATVSWTERGFLPSTLSAPRRLSDPFSGGFHYVDEVFDVAFPVGYQVGQDVGLDVG